LFVGTHEDNMNDLRGATEVGARSEKVNYDDLEEAYRLRVDERLTWNELARRYGYARPDGIKKIVTRWALKYGYSLEGLYNRVNSCAESRESYKLSPETIWGIWDLAKSGITLAEISEKLGVGKVTIRKVTRGQIYPEAMKAFNDGVPYRFKMGTSRSVDYSYIKKEVEETGQPATVVAAKYGISYPAYRNWVRRNR